MRYLGLVLLVILGATLWLTDANWKKSQQFVGPMMVRFDTADASDATTCWLTTTGGAFIHGNVIHLEQKKARP